MISTNILSPIFESIVFLRIQPDSDTDEEFDNLASKEKKLEYE
jgi:hypothetical protein